MHTYVRKPIQFINFIVSLPFSHCTRISWGRQLILWGLVYETSWQLEEYPSARVPQGQPYILDPANPFNNLYQSGVGSFDPGTHFCEYAPGDGKWEPFAEKVHSLDLCA